MMIVLPSPKDAIVKGFVITLLVKSAMSFKVSWSTVFKKWSTGFLQICWENKNKNSKRKVRL